MNVVAVVGGEFNPQPDDISLAHNGVLFLDEQQQRTPLCARNTKIIIIITTIKENADSLERRKKYRI